ncbi:MAG: tRNA pseudouridine(55) synthase TruB [Candidatus Dormibacteraeota bacterium]|nr:tRNA pseudouridine(55) synthase TruB [Candidatus Dormibacteraeota bacterium]
MDSGILNVAKPVGISSFSAVQMIGRLPGIDKVGHGGTLDPAADGVLPILVNAATRLAEFVHVWPKTYLATVAFGKTSDTYDREGTILGGGATTGVTAEHIVAELPAFTGRIEQVPPMFSALKQAGEPLYRKARRGETVARAARPVEVHALRLLDYDDATAIGRLEIVSGQGLYVRSLAHDLGQRLGCGAYLAALTRSRYGPLLIDDALSPAAMSADAGGWVKRLLPMDLPLAAWPALRLDEADATAIGQGRSIAAGDVVAARVRLLDGRGTLLGWGTVDADRRIQPRAVFPR